jgi:OOP family OmpA-OmpF porin
MITKFGYGCVLTAAGMAISSGAFATDIGPYISIGIGMHIPGDSTAHAQIPTGTPASNFKSELEPGFIGVSSIGYKWVTGFRTELEAGYRQSDFGKINDVSANGAQQVLSVSANLLYDFDTSSKFTPYLGGGLGIASYKWSNVSTSVSPHFNDRASAFQWQGIAGVNMRVSDRTKVFVEYRYIGAGSTQFESLPAGSVVTGHDDRSSNVLAGVRFALNS